VAKAIDELEKVNSQIVYHPSAGDWLLARTQNSIYKKNKKSLDDGESLRLWHPTIG
jgi:hypothetical protein